MKRLRIEYNKLSKEPVPYAIARPLEKNILEWRFLIKGTGDYEGGFYQYVFHSVIDTAVLMFHLLPLTLCDSKQWKAGVSPTVSYEASEHTFLHSEWSFRDQHEGLSDYLRLSPGDLVATLDGRQHSDWNRVVHEQR
jgi:hypothetical protein